MRSSTDCNGGLIVTDAKKNADGYTFKELYDAAADKETEVKPMTENLLEVAK
jgi:hypothetical protein